MINDVYILAIETSCDDTSVAILKNQKVLSNICLLYTSPSPRDRQKSRMPSSA